MAGLYTTYQLAGLQQRIRTLPKFWLQYFTRQINFTTDEIAFDKLTDDQRSLAPFVHPMAQGRMISHAGYATKTFKPAYVKPKHVVDPNKVLPRQPGEAIGTGSLTNDQRRQAVIAYNMMMERQMIENRWEWMAAQAILTGKVIVEGDDYPSVTVDFGRDASLTQTVDWTASGYTSDNTFADLLDLKRDINDLSYSGTVIRDYIFGGDAWAKFQSINKDILYGLGGLMDRNVGGSETSVTRITEGLEGVEYAGSISGLAGAGRMNIWINTQKYKKADGTTDYLMPQGGISLVSPDVDGVRCFGAIMDASASYNALDIYPKNYMTEDPCVEYTLSQSSPLMVPVDPNATGYIQVIPV